MKIRTQELGYREIEMLSEFTLRISRYGIFNDIPKEFYYDVKADEARCVTEKGDTYHFNSNGKVGAI